MLTPYGHIWYMNAWSGYGCFVNDEESNKISANGLISGYIFNVWVDLRNDYREKQNTYIEKISL